jgi:hypothetical protein
MGREELIIPDELQVLILCGFAEKVRMNFPDVRGWLERIGRERITLRHAPCGGMAARIQIMLENPCNFPESWRFHPVNSYSL